MENSAYVFRFIIVGDSGVGKTCLLKRYEQDNFDPFSANTVGVEYIRKNIVIDSQNITVQVWDTAGQEHMNSITRTYFKNCCAVLLVYDITSRTSFENIQKWLHDIEENAQENIKKILIGNKQDLEFNRVVEINEGEAFAKVHRMEFREASAKSSLGVNEVFNLISHEVYMDV